MAQIRHIATSKSAILRTEAALVQLDNGQTLSIPHASLSTFDTEAKLRTELERQAGQRLENLFIHLNRDNTIALAVGQEPDLWPEDRPPIQDIIPDNLKKMLEDQPTNQQTNQQTN